MDANLHHQAYPSVQAAAEAALSAAVRPTFDPDGRGGIIVEKGGSYYYSEPEKVNHTKLTIFFYGGMVGMYHTHSKDLRVSDYFSLMDVKEANRLFVWSYIGVESCHCIREYAPDGVVEWATPGRYVGLIPKGVHGNVHN